MYSLKLYTYLAPSKVCDGVGVFSLVPIPADTLIFKPEEMKKGMWWEVPEEIHDYLKSLTYYDEEGFWIDCDLDKLGPQYYINHSLSPNVSYNKDNGCLYSTRDIQPDEELLDYYFLEEREWHT
jgi:hypothetical protein